MSRISVFGAGAWGTALALSLCKRSDHTITLWSHSATHGARLASERENRTYLPGYALPPSLRLTNNLAEAAAEAEILVSVVPSEHTRTHFEQLGPFLKSGQVIVSATKGIEDGTLMRMSEVIAQTLLGRSLILPVGALSGPSFAQEVAAGLPAAVAIAFQDRGQASLVQAQFTTPALRLYRNEDLTGVELGGALKNVIAIAVGAVAGTGLGHSAAAALITRGISEITRLALACGGRRETLSGLSGVGDLVLTCTGSLSRNRWVGLEIGRGVPLTAILSGLGGKVAEGVRTTTAALGLAARHGVDMPITTQVAALLRGDRSTHDAMRELMSRATGEE